MNAAHFLRRRGQAAQVETDAAQQRIAIRLGRRLQSLFFQTSQHEEIQSVPRPGPIADAGERRTLGLEERPVFGIRRTLVDPALERRDLRECQRVAALHGRHAFAFILGRNARDQQALAGRAGHEGRAALARQNGRLAAVQAQLGGAMAFILAVTGKTVLRQDRPNVAVVIDGNLGRQPRRRDREQDQAGEDNRFHHNLAAVGADHRRAVRQDDSIYGNGWGENNAPVGEFVRPFRLY